MPRLKADAIFLFKNKKKKLFVEIFYSLKFENKIRMKINKKWFKNKIIFEREKLNSLISNTISEFI